MMGVLLSHGLGRQFPSRRRRRRRLVVLIWSVNTENHIRGKYMTPTFPEYSIHLLQWDSHCLRIHWLGTGLVKGGK
jgi:hypothetical protein